MPLHSFKHAAQLQHARAHNAHPLLIRIDKKAGHGAGKSTEMRLAPIPRRLPLTLPLMQNLSFSRRIKEAADKWGFAAQTLCLTWFDDLSN